MSDLEREEVYTELGEILDNIYEMFDNYEVDVEDDEEFSEINDLFTQVRRLIGKGE